jgi:signal transduction histidine kinase
MPLTALVPKSYFASRHIPRISPSPIVWIPKNRSTQRASSVRGQVLKFNTIRVTPAYPGSQRSHCAHMADATTLARPQATLRPPLPLSLRVGIALSLSVLLGSALAAVLLPKGFALAAFGDILQVSLVTAVTILSFQNFLRSHSRVRIFWFLIFAGSFLWAISNGIWAVSELRFAQLVPDVPLADILLFVKVVPLTAAIAIAPDRRQDDHFRAFGLLDVFVLMIYSLYLFAFGVFAFRLLPGAQPSYDFYFNVADAIGNQTLVVVVGVAVLRADGNWRGLYRLYFCTAACYALGSNLCNVAIDAGNYYTGSLYDLPLIASLVAFVCMVLAGRTSCHDQRLDPAPRQLHAPSTPATFLSEHLAMLVALSTPVVGIWLLSSASAPPALRTFRITITLLTIFLMTLLLSIKQDILAAGLFQSLRHLSETRGSIERFKTHLTQSEKLASLGQLVAQVANQIKGCMASILDASSRLTSRPDLDSRILNMAGKIGQYAQRTDVLVNDMLHFAKETPVRLVSLDVKPVIDSALHLSRIARMPKMHVDLTQDGNCQRVCGDSGHLLLVFLQLISNAIDALEEVGGGTLHITLRSNGSQLMLEFADSGAGLKEPQRVFDPFYTTKPVGKGTGLGLSTCYGIIQQHDGEISCHNRPEGGAVFTILLPAAPEPAPQSVPLETTLVAEGVR